MEFTKQPDVIQDTNELNKTENEMLYCRIKSKTFQPKASIETVNWQLAKSKPKEKKLINDEGN